MPLFNESPAGASSKVQNNSPLVYRWTWKYFWHNWDQTVILFLFLYVCILVEYLHCKAEIIKDIPLLDKATPPMLVSAQACVARSMEENW